ncbi:hypothetical protein [Oscillatoria sp. FACHB-1406]|uniref:hypothetical protein n=1 Tax=Oscillatoria sp. FACHB-1406 TaxID=2692846 RepID=UPI001681F25D|nr:hypothetical protein [Oscillatoria sp. FACHB-1406]MBD2580092.1 hypothetical protein [Oscillatoria sp. FACHB-1406]
MARSLQHIEQDLTKLSERVKALAEQLDSRYNQYFERLGQLVKRHLVLACYQTCTQVYPEAFLALSVSGRQQLQQQMRELGREAIAQLKVTEEASEAELEEIESPPARLLRLMQRRDRAAQQVLQTIAARANTTLRDAAILPERSLPRGLEIAIQGEEATIALEDLPNFLQPPEDDAEETNSDTEVSIIPAVGIRLQLSELEFSDPGLGVERNKIRQMLSSLKQLSKQYQQHERELAIAQAELAWRASWYED